MSEPQNSGELVLAATRDGIAYLTINRPKALNALNEAVIGELETKFNAAEADTRVTAIVIRGAGEKAFVAGADIKFFIDNIKNNRIPDTVAFTTRGHELLRRIEKCKKITVAVLDGLSLGGGSELALACQAIVATAAGSMGFPETAIGIYPGFGGMLRSARQIGCQLTKYFVFTGRNLSAQDAYDLGIFTKLVEPADLEKTIASVCAGKAPDKYRNREIPPRFKEMAEVCSPENVKLLLAGKKPVGVADEFAEKTLKAVAKKAPLALKIANELIDVQEHASIREAMNLELARLGEIFATEDALVGLSSVGGKEPPKYQGK
ncbi:MAG: enoyl-CoA hydratase/isomerase family protein [Desulfobulbaceae bacterium]|jgi:enoyl-CoA hydratase/3-hydroxyacyl-CoA dehydrogenase|nr:enoyl-CoA hydratase/isomerase family protein [Desulfobulbaceae bacterium]